MLTTMNSDNDDDDVTMTTTMTTTTRMTKMPMTKMTMTMMTKSRTTMMTMMDDDDDDNHDDAMSTTMNGNNDDDDDDDDGSDDNDDDHDHSNFHSRAMGGESGSRHTMARHAAPSTSLRSGNVMGSVVDVDELSVGRTTVTDYGDDVTGAAHDDDWSVSGRTPTDDGNDDDVGSDSRLHNMEIFRKHSGSGTQSSPDSDSSPSLIHSTPLPSSSSSSSSSFAGNSPGYLVRMIRDASMANGGTSSNSLFINLLNDPATHSNVGSDGIGVSGSSSSIDISSSPSSSSSMPGFDGNGPNNSSIGIGASSLHGKDDEVDCIPRTGASLTSSSNRHSSLASGFPIRKSPIVVPSALDGALVVAPNSNPVLVCPSSETQNLTTRRTRSQV
jgi:hypothetical protein